MGLFEIWQTSGCFGIVIPLTILMIEDDSDRELICRMYMDYRNLMYAVAREYFQPGEADMDDAIGTTVERLCRYCSAVRRIPEGRRKQYIVTVTGNVCRDLLRKRKKLNEIIDPAYPEGELENIPDRHDPIETIFDRASANELIEAFNVHHIGTNGAICLLCPWDRELIRMHHIDKIPISVIARELDCTDGKVRTALWRARKNLLRVLNDRKERQNETDREESLRPGII